MVLQDRLPQLQIQSVTRLDGNDPQGGQEQLHAEIKRKDGIFDLVAVLLRGRLYPHLRRHFVDLQVERKKNKITANQGAETEYVILADLLGFDDRLEHALGVGGQRIADDAVVSAVQ